MRVSGIQTRESLCSCGLLLGSLLDMRDLFGCPLPQRGEIRSQLFDLIRRGAKVGIMRKEGQSVMCTSLGKILLKAYPGNDPKRQ